MIAQAILVIGSISARCHVARLAAGSTRHTGRIGIGAQYRFLHQVTRQKSSHVSRGPVSPRLSRSLAGSQRPLLDIQLNTPTTVSKYRMRNQPLRFFAFVVLGLVLGALALTNVVAADPKPQLDEKRWSGMQWRQMGPFAAVAAPGGKACRVSPTLTISAQWPAAFGKQSMAAQRGHRFSIK